MLAAGGSLDIADAFSTDLYTGNDGTQTITNGIDLDGEGGLIWIKCRNAAEGHWLTDTETNQLLRSNTNSGGFSNSIFNYSYLSDGWSINTADAGVNDVLNTYAAWTFRKAPKFFDVVTYTGNDVAGRTVAHDLGSVPGAIIIKSRSQPRDWYMHHRGVNAQTWTGTATGALTLNSTAANDTGKSYFGTVSDTGFDLQRTSGDLNVSGETYVAYLFAHDTGDDSVIQCGSYTGNGSTTGPVVTLGWEPQWLLIKRSNAAANWHIFDAARGLTTSTDKSLRPNLSSAEMGVQGTYQATATGFTVNQAYNDFNASGSTYIYMAIRKEVA
jgi:hypothetical protein